MATQDFIRYGIIYLVVHRDSGKTYVGQTIKSLAERWYSHRTCSYCALLHNAIQKYGADAFDVFEVDFADSKDDLDAREVFWIEFLGTRNRKLGYNLRAGGSFGKHSQESRAKMSAAVRKAYENPAHRAAQIERLRSIVLPPDFGERVSLGLTGLSPSKDTRVKMSSSRKQLWATEESASRMKDASTLAKRSATNVERASAKSKEQWQDPDARAKLLAAQAAGKAAFWADPEKRAARIAKRAATMARKRAELNP